jgi:GTP-binding protein HflX
MTKYSKKLQKLHETAPKEDTAVLVALIKQGQSDRQVHDY